MKDLEELRKIAENATPGPWRIEYENSDDWEAGINDGDYPHTIHGPRNVSYDGRKDKSRVQEYLNRITEITEMTDADATHIATFDPPTVLALIERVEAAEKKATDLFDEGIRQKKRAIAAEKKVKAVRKLVSRNSLYGSVECDDLDAALDGDDQ